MTFALTIKGHPISTRVTQESCQQLIAQRYPLPASFRDFVTNYGYGRSLGLLIVYPPMEGHPDSLSNQMSRIRNFVLAAIDGQYLEYDPDGSPQLARGLYPFAMSENGEYFAWFIDDAARHPSEYPIYAIGARMGSIRFAANDMHELFSKLCTPDIKNILGTGYKPLPATFEPF